MAVVRVRIRRQVTIPKKVFDKLQMEIGDFVEATAEDGKIVMIPKRLTARKESVCRES